MADQRNQQFQTILIAGTIMITALISVLIQGALPIDSTMFIKYAYSITNSSSLLFLIISIILCIELTSRVNKFMYKRSSSNLKHLNDAINHTKKVMLHINEQRKDRKLKSSGRIVNQERRFKLSSLRIDQSIAKLSDLDVDIEWMSHETEIHHYLDRRGKINERIDLLTGENKKRLSFEDFWSSKCESIGFLSLLSFYVGTSSM